MFEAVLEYARLARLQGLEPVLIGGSDEQTAADVDRLSDFEVVTAPLHNATLGFAPGLLDKILNADLDLLHLNGIWQLPSYQAATWAAQTRRPYLISPHGMLDPWIVRRGKLKKWLARIGFEKRSWRRASMFHALTEAEAGDIVRVTGREAITIIPNPINQPETMVKRDVDIDGTQRVIYLSRIHPKKNVETLVDAWLAVDAVKSGDWLLDIFGWGDADHCASLRDKIERSGSSTVAFHGAVFGAEKAAVLERARFLILPSHSEGLPMAVLEAWAAGTPTLMSEACHLPLGIMVGAALDCGTKEAEISASLHRALTLPVEQWQGMSQRAVALARTSFSADAVGARLAHVYRSLSDLELPQR